MSSMQDPVESLVRRLNTQRKLRVWSVIITFFGDAVVPRSGAVSAKTVQEVMERLGFEPGAVRTAFSRLTRDGWVVREKQGRSSFYRLSETGLDTFADATRKIYAPLEPEPTSDAMWTVSFSSADMSTPQISAAGVSSIDPNQLVITGSFENIPDWFRLNQFSAEPANAMQFLMKTFAPLNDAELSPLDALAVRCLLIHEWRRILLNLPSVPLPFRPKNWPEADCHRFVSSLYRQIVPKSENWIDGEALGPEGAMPSPHEDFYERFS